jgi:hypothetical protein
MTVPNVIPARHLRYFTAVLATKLLTLYVQLERLVKGVGQRLVLGQTRHCRVVVCPQHTAQMRLADMRMTTAAGVQTGGMVRGE